MTQIVMGAAVGLVMGVTLGAACGIRAETEPTDAMRAIAEEVGLDPYDLLGALNTTGLEPREYLYQTSVLERPKPPAPSGWPFGGALGQRIYCIEGIESTHGVHMYNPSGWPPPYYNEHAQGWLGWLPSTARRWGVRIGDRVSEWDGAARMILAGAGTQFYGVGAGIC